MGLASTYLVLAARLAASKGTDGRPPSLTVTAVAWALPDRLPPPCRIGRGVDVSDYPGEESTEHQVLLPAEAQKIAWAAVS
jgi:hypothetical protein